ncbi:class I adenylate-forming enzyme family protein [Brevibacillus fulvus]|uniref:Acyl-coenzyme A synthetase/AMP-(Fatty) acid ligase n=1 Tax=Brevibacillus fulvus TaxID=1125967 RepID=A0A939BRN5_9BACL|nr:class I adenylate-forming enzyme family protein [Brevibacillus fulvus]MBM7589638.1 acyl-coenzyme A synthetase/AMP-(fatty) acid ligase [Brevibacillus fulvus]
MGRLSAWIMQHDHPQKIAISDGTESITYGELPKYMAAIQHAVATLQEENGKRPVGVVVDQSATSALILLSLIDGGVSFLPLDQQTTQAEQDRLAKMAFIRRWIKPDGGDRAISYSRLLAKGESRSMETGATETDLSASSAVVLLPTSGSTGPMKLAQLTHAVLYREGLVYKEWFDFTADDIALTTTPLNYMYGLTGSLMGSVLAGATLRICSAPTPRKVASEALASRSTILFGVPLLYQLLTQAEMITSNQLSALRMAISAGGRLDPAIASAFHGKFGARLLQVYGSTETGAIAATDPTGAETDGAVGSILPEVEVELTDQQVIVVRSPSLFQGYVTAEHGFVSPLHNGAYVTADIGMIKGRQLFLTGRQSEFINVAGRKVNANEIAQVLRSFPGILQAKVVGENDSLYGQKIIAYVVAEAAVSPQDIRFFLARHLAFYKIPHEIKLTAELPRSWKEQYVHQDREMP